MKAREDCRRAAQVPAQIRDFALRIAGRFQPEKIILFGSCARGKAKPGSDVDLLMIMSHEGRPAVKAAEIASAIPRPFPVDLIVRSPQKCKSGLRWGISFSAL